VQYNKRAVQKSKNPQEEHTVTIQKKSLISTLNTTKKAIVASTPADTATVSPATKNMGSRNMGSKNMGSKNMGSKNMGSKNMGSKNMGSRNLGSKNL
jgi:hypothetical protein